MKKHRLRHLKFLPIGLAAIAFFSAIVMLLWNFLMPDIAGLPQIDFCQAVGLFIFARIFFGGSIRDKFWAHELFHDHRTFKNEWKNMTTEQRVELIEKLSAVRDRCGHWHEHPSSEKSDKKDE